MLPTRTLLRTWLLAALCLASLAVAPFTALGQETNSRMFRFRAPAVAEYRVETAAGGISTSSPKQWVRAWTGPSGGNPVQLGGRIVLKLAEPKDLSALIQGLPLELDRVVETNLFILQAPDALSGLSAAETLAGRPGVIACHPIIRRPVKRHGAYYPQPNDPYFAEQWHLENRDTNGQPAGADLNVRAAWPAAQGENILIAVADTGIDLGHPDLQAAAKNSPHFNFFTRLANGLPYDPDSDHGTAVAGLALAALGNKKGVCGVAPKASLASWVVLADNVELSDEDYMDMYQFRSNIVAVQNHSWGYTGLEQVGFSLLVQSGIYNAARAGRGGKGVVMVRAGGNEKGSGRDVNDEAESNNPRFIAVAATRDDGRVASYSQRGACLLVAAPSGDTDFRNLVTTDRRGQQGYNQQSAPDDSADYTLGDAGFDGTSGSAPQIAGLAALILSANTNLHYRDVQQILILSARHFDLADPNLATNGAGLRVSHNLGFGVPDAGEAVRLAKNWPSRPAVTAWSGTLAVSKSIPEEGPLQIRASQPGFDPALAAPNALASLGPSGPAAGPLPMIYIGLADENLAEDLAGKCALIQRGEYFFYEKIARAAARGAGFAVIFNNQDATDVFVMSLTEFTPIPAVFIGQNDGELLRDRILARQDLSARLNLTNDAAGAVFQFNVPAALLCEQVGVRVQSSHSRRGDLQITLVSPAGTRSVLQPKNLDNSSGPADWTYYSTQHFFESAAGTWTVYVLDQRPGVAGAVQRVDLTVTGVPIVDTDHDGLDDRWELEHFQSLNYGPNDDPDHDGYSNIREYLAGTDPAKNEVEFRIDFSPWNSKIARLSWPGQPNQRFDVFKSPNPQGRFGLITNLAGCFPETELFIGYTNPPVEFFKVRAAP